MALYPFQERVHDNISAGKSVILQAPTGAGKTRAALYPFLKSWEELAPFPRKCIYSVPLRVLASQFNDEYSSRVDNFGFVRPLHVGIQTGLQPYDPKLEDSLIFTTIDQTLSNFLSIPYALSLRQGNLNAGAIMSSYLIFDELHLFDPENTLPTTLHLLKLISEIVPVMVMTATLSNEMVAVLAKYFGAEPMVLSEQEVATIPSQKKTRRIHIRESLLTPERVLERHDHRSIAICNTIARAQELFRGIKAMAGAGTEVRLLHSRFLPKHRGELEEWLRREFGRESDGQRTVDDAILVATQVIEVGVDITSRCLHTELAPAASVIQRAGRCARYEKEVGDVFVYDLPLDERGQRRYAPYAQNAEKSIIDTTWNELSERSGSEFDFGAELALVNRAHRNADETILAKLDAQRHYFAGRIAETIEAQERGAASELIRHVDSRTVIVHPEPREIDNPWRYEGFGLHVGSLLGAYDALAELADDLACDWVMMTADAMPEDPDASQSKIVYRWRVIVDKEDLASALMVAVNPEIVRYSPDTGFQLAEKGDPTWQSDLRKNNRDPLVFPPYRRETLLEHVIRMMRVCKYPFFDRRNGRQRNALFDEISYATMRLERKQGWPQGTIIKLITTIIAVHDLGKLDKRWQEWAHVWQETVSEIRGMDLTIPVSYMAAHTDFDSQNKAEWAANLKMRYRRPNHAAESAKAAIGILFAQAGDQGLARAAITTIVRHHGAGAKGQSDRYEADSRAPKTYADITAALDLPLQADAGIEWSFEADESLTRRMIRPRRESELLAYMLMVRVLRLADQRSQEWLD